MLLHIERGDWLPGDRLPSERVLAEQWQLSRATVREAITIIKQQGLITSKVGSGHFVAGDTVPLFVAPAETSHTALREYRVAVESQTAFLAAQRADAEQLRKIERAHQHLRHVHQKNDLKAEGLADARFHLAIAEASGNPILAQSLRGLFSLLRANVTQNIGAIAGRRPETRLRLMKQHTALFEAIYYHKPEKARATAQEHMAFVDRILNDL